MNPFVYNLYISCGRTQDCTLQRYSFVADHRQCTCYPHLDIQLIRIKYSSINEYDICYIWYSGKTSRSNQTSNKKKPFVFSIYLLRISQAYNLLFWQLLLNCCFFVFLLHILYALFLSRLGMKASLVLPRWLMNAL